MEIGTTLLKGDLEWLLTDMARCLAMVEVFRVLLVDMAVAIRCKVAMGALQALVDIPRTVKPAVMADTKGSILTYSTRQSNSVAICDVFHFFGVTFRTFYTNTGLVVTIGMLEPTSIRS